MERWRETGLAYSDIEIIVARYDNHRDLIWVGKSDGFISSYYGASLIPYVSFKAHNGKVKDIQLSDDFVLSLGDDGIASHTRNGLLVTRCSPSTGDKLLVLDNAEFLVAFKRRIAKYTISPQIKEIGFFQIDSIPMNVKITHISRISANIALGLSDGTVEIIEPKTFESTLAKPLRCHSGPITDMDSQKTVLVTCGLSQRRFGTVPDVFISCYDTRSSKMQLPLTVSSGASFVRLHPKAPNRAVVLGLRGQLTFLDSKDSTNVVIKHLVLHDSAQSLDIGPFGDCLIVSEKNSVHFWTNKASVATDDFKGLEVPSALNTYPLPVLTDKSPLSSVGIPHYSFSLLSNWNAQDVFETGIPTPNWEKVENPLISMSHASSVKKRRPSLVSVPRFLSEQARMQSSGLGYAPEALDVNEQAFTDILKSDAQLEEGKVPRLWRKMHLHYSKFGVDDFDFKYYNDTNYSSLEPLSSNPYCNALLQLYRWCPTMYNVTLNAFASNNYKELDATGELAIILDMLVDAQGYHCRATNFIDTLPISSLKLDKMHEYMINALISEYHEEIGGESPLIEMVSTVSVDSIFNLSEIPSIAKQQIGSNAPEVLFVVIEDVDKDLISPRDDSMVSETIDLKEKGTFKLTGYVSEIVNTESDRHGVAVIMIEERWYLFNDFLVTEIAKDQALDFKSFWKRPRILMYHNTAAKSEYDNSWKEHIDFTLLHDQKLKSGNCDFKSIYPELMLQKGEEVPKVIALDAEFVLVRKEIAELYNDGTKNLISPKKLSLARVSVVRENETVLIDDIVESTQPVLDYVTAYSGVEPGDLDPLTSRYGLVARKTATRRLWILLKVGTKFIGHALVNDFRCINLYAPPSQVIDTVDIFYNRQRNGLRRLSLKFLMWAVLGDHVQQGNHDSVQDAQSALRLYKRYVELQKAGGLDAMLDKIWKIGQQCNYKVPDRAAGSSGSPSASSTPTHHS